VPCVVKADGLAAGKGVFVCRHAGELEHALQAAVRFDAVVVEELLEGEEVSLFALCDGRNAVALPPARDFKRALDGDDGPNTGGMGSYAPVADVSAAAAAELVELVHAPVLRELELRGTPFVGLLFAGLMLTAEGPRVLEFNSRFGDPETQSILPLLDGDLLAALAAAADGDLAGVRIDQATGAAVTVVLAAAGYPERGDKGSAIEGVAAAEATGALVSHAGTALEGDALVTNGGRILGVTALGESVAEARERAYDAADLISFRGARRRSDIALGAAVEQYVG
jgi:phosphoribosylamine--glycine ligase